VSCAGSNIGRLRPKARLVPDFLNDVLRARHPHWIANVLKAEGFFTMDYPDTLLFIDGHWRESASGYTREVLNPATDERLGALAHAGVADLDIALEGVMHLRRI
jgi:hypothetical protein